MKHITVFDQFLWSSLIQRSSIVMLVVRVGVALIGIVWVWLGSCLGVGVVLGFRLSVVAALRSRPSVGAQVIRIIIETLQRKENFINQGQNKYQPANGKHRCLLTGFLPAGPRFWRLLLGVISRLVLRSKLLAVVARGILGTPALA